MSGPVAFDPRPLTDPVDRTAVRDFARRLRAEGRLPGSVSGAAAIAVAVVVGVFVVGTFGSILAGLIAAVVSSGSPLGTFFFVPLLLIGGVLAVMVVAVVRGASGGAERRYRLDAFARRNGMTYVPGVEAPALPGMIFDIGGSRTATDLLRGSEPRFVEFGNYRYTTGSGKSRTTHRWGYVAVRLDAPLPHIVLDAAGNNGLFGGSNLPAVWDRDQRLSLEGDFDRYFSLSCPAGYERDALYLFTPDIMARFVDNAAALDVEIVDDWLFLYAQRDLSTLDPATWAWLFTVVAALLDKLGQWGRWRDDRLAGTTVPVAVTGMPGAGVAQPAPLLTPPPVGVAAPGRRLRRGVPWAALVVMGVFGAGWVVLQLVGDLLDR